MAAPRKDSRRKVPCEGGVILVRMHSIHQLVNNCFKRLNYLEKRGRAGPLSFDKSPAIYLDGSPDQPLVVMLSRWQALVPKIDGLKKEMARVYAPLILESLARANMEVIELDGLTAGPEDNLLTWVHELRHQGNFDGAIKILKAFCRNEVQEELIKPGTHYHLRQLADDHQV